MLPAPQLQQALEEAPDLRQPLEGHLLSLTPQQVKLNDNIIAFLCFISM